MGTTGGDPAVVTAAADKAGVYAIVSPQMGKQVRRESLPPASGLGRCVSQLTSAAAFKAAAITGTLVPSLPCPATCQQQMLYTPAVAAVCWP